MESQVAMPRAEQVAATAIGAMICVVIMLAMFTAPDSHQQEQAVIPSCPRPLADSLEYRPDFVFTAENIFALFVIGLVSGTFGAMLGMGGGVLKMSCLLLFFGFHPGISKFAALFSYFVVAVGASYRYLKLNFVMTDVVKVLIPSSILGIIAGALIGHYLPRDVLTLLLGVFLLLVSAVMVRRILTRCEGLASRPGEIESEQTDRVNAASPKGWIIAVCGFPGGLLSAMLGISGGVLSNPLQQVLAHIPIKNAIANTLLTATVAVPIACLMIIVMGVRMGHFDFWSPLVVTLFIIPGSIIGSQLGPALTRRMSTVSAHALFGAVVFVMGISMLFFS